MKTVIFYFWNVETTPSLYRLVFPFVQIKVAITFSRILYMRRVTVEDSISTNPLVSAL